MIIDDWIWRSSNFLWLRRNTHLAGAKLTLQYWVCCRASPACVLLVNWENHIHFWSESFRKEKKHFNTTYHGIQTVLYKTLIWSTESTPIFSQWNHNKKHHNFQQEKHVVYSIDGNAIFLPFNMKYIIWITHRTQHGLSIGLLQAMQALRSCVPAPCFCELTV